MANETDVEAQRDRHLNMELRNQIKTHRHARRDCGHLIKFLALKQQFELKIQLHFKVQTKNSKYNDDHEFR
jgi:hypothetical protein